MRDNAFSKMIILLVGNKDDLNTEREITTQEGQEFADQNDLLFFETSAKTRHNIDNVFKSSASIIFENIKNT